MKITYQPETDSFYFYLKEGVGSVRQEEVAPETILDFDEEGNVIGIEVYGSAAQRIDLGRVKVERYDRAGQAAAFSLETQFLIENAPS